MGLRTKLNLKEIQYLITNKPLRVVLLEHSDRNKKLIIKALELIRARQNGDVTLRVLQKFLSDVAPKYHLSKSQDGARSFLLREIERLMTTREPSFWGSMFSSLRLQVSTSK